MPSAFKPFDVDLVLEVAVRTGRGDAPAAIATELDVHVDVVYASFKLIVHALPTPRHRFRNVNELRDALLADAGAAAPGAPARDRT